MQSGESIHKRVSHYACTDNDVMYRDLHISDEGYNPGQVSESREQYGSNMLTGHSSDTVFFRLRRAFVNPFTVILFVLACVSFITDVLLASNFSRNETTVVIIVCMLLISGLVRFIQEMRSKQVYDHLSEIIQTDVQVRRDGAWKDITSEELVVGDRIRLAAGDRVPADIRLTAASDLFISQSVISGESAVLEKIAGTLPEGTCQSYGDFENVCFMGSVVVGGTGEGIVLAVGKDTVYGGFSETAASRKNGFDTGANSIAWVMIRFMVVLVPVVFIACGLTKGDWFAAFLFALSVAVGLTPEMLPMVINACLAKGSATTGQKETIVRNINAMQGFGSIDILCVDKTGTLTGDTLLLEYYMDILGNESDTVLNYAFLNSLYHTGVRNHLDAAILKCRSMPGREAHFKEFAELHPKLDELPFDYDRKFASVLVGGEADNLLIVKGCIEEVCSRCSYAAYRGTRQPFDPSDASNVHMIVDEMLEDGMKVLAVAYKELAGDQMHSDDEYDLTLLGYLAFFDAPKTTAADAVRQLKSLNVDVRVLTGDHTSTAVSVCRRLGIDAEHVLNGGTFDSLSEDDKTLLVERTTVFTELSPKQKVQIVQILRTNGHTVGFLGDGMNDLPAIVESDVGISVDTAMEAVRESADVILLKKDLNVLEQGILEGRKAFSNMSKYVRITASSNFGNIFSIVIASVFLPFFPMTAVQLLLLNLLYDTLCLVLPWDHVDEDSLSRPLQWSGRTLGRFMLTFGPVSSVFDIATFAFMFFVLCPALCGGSFLTIVGTAEQTRFVSLFQTGWFLESMWTQVLILHLLRTKKLPLIQSRPSAPVMLVTTLGILLLTVVTFTPAGGIIGLTSLPPIYFGFLILTVCLYLLLITATKRWYVKKYHELL